MKHFCICLMLLLLTPFQTLSDPHREYYESGALLSEKTYKKGKEDGVQRVYYESGVLKAEFPFKNGDLEGGVSYITNQVRWDL